MGTLKTIYDASPRFLRSLYVNAYGLNNQIRHRKWDRLIGSLAHTERMDRDAQIDMVEKRLKGILRHAINHIPFYSRFSPLLGDFDSRSAFDLLQEFPITTKESINRDPEAFRDLARRDFVISRTSGTTGTPFSVYMDKQSFLLEDALWWRRTLWAGHRKGDWIARLVGDPVVPLAEKDPREPWLISRTDRRIYMSTFHLNEGSAVRIGEMLRRRQPAYIMGYPSSLEILCGYLKDAGFRMDWELRNVLFSSEPMHDHQERIIGEVLGAEIRGLFGSGEKLVSAAQCPHGRYHLSLVDGFIEGQFGIMDKVKPAAVTTLTNPIMPLIRYQIGDVIETQPDLVCACGRTLPVISPVITKHEDWIITPSGRKIAPSAVVWAFIHQDIKDIRQGQVVQETERLVRVHLTADEETFLRYRDILKHSMHEVFFGEMEVEVVRTEHIEVSKAGKSRFIVNKLKPRD